MNNNKSNNFNDENLERIFADSTELPLESVVKNVTPWREAIKKIVIGMIFQAVRLEFLMLNEILPPIGVILVVMGLRSLKNENKWFNVCYVISLIESLFVIISLGIKATIYNNAITDSALWLVFSLVGVAVEFASLFCLWKAICQVQKKAGLPPHCKSLIALMFWSAVIVVLSFAFKTISWITGLVLLASYIAIIVCLFKITKEIDVAGYVITPSTVGKMSVLLPILLTFLMIATPVVSNALFGHYDMEWSPVTEMNSTDKTAEVMEKLLDLGFPQDVLKDLSDEDVMSCQDAVFVVSETRDFDHENLFKVKKGELILSNVAVKLSNGNWEIFQHFRWEGDRIFYGTELMNLWPVDYEGYSERNSELRGKLLCEIDSKTFTADYYTLTEETYTSNSVFFGSQEETEIFGEFSLPRNAENGRGYIAYGVNVYDEGRLFNIMTNYRYANYPTFPVMTAKEYEKSGMWESNPPFNLRQKQLLFGIKDFEE